MVTSSLFGQERGLVRDVEPSLMLKKDGVIFEKIPHQPQGDRIYLTYIGIPQFLISIISYSSFSKRSAKF